jgi:hypothetical protein
VLAAYGGVFVAGSLAWGVVFDAFRPDRYDMAGALGLPDRRRHHHVRAAMTAIEHNRDLVAV